MVGIVTFDPMGAVMGATEGVPPFDEKVNVLWSTVHSA